MVAIVAVGKHFQLRRGRPHSQRLLTSVLFFDLVGFTSVSEKLDPQVLTDWLNRWSHWRYPTLGAQRA